MAALLKVDELQIVLDDTWYFLTFNNTLLSRFQIGKNYYHSLPYTYMVSDILSNFRTLDEYRNKGYGRYLLTSVMKQRKFFLCSYKEAEGFYRKCGLNEVHIEGFRYTIFENL